MNLMPHKRILYTNWTLFRLSTILLFLSVFSLLVVYTINLTDQTSLDIKQGIQQLREKRTQLSNEYDTLATNYDQILYENHLMSLEKESIAKSKEQVEKAYEELLSTESGELLDRINRLYEQYNEVLELIEKNKSVGLDTGKTESSISDWGLMFLNKEYDKLEATLSSTQESLSNDYAEYLASLPTPTPTPVPVVYRPVSGYSYQLVTTEKGNFSAYVIKLPLSSYKVVTITANATDCKDNCPAKSLKDYVVENGAYAGMNGTYFCPPDYSSCADKKYSYDFAVYNSKLGKWLSEASLSWNGLGLAAFNGSTPMFLVSSQSYDGQAVTAGIVNFPTLLSGGSIVVDPNGLTSYQKDVKGTRGAIGTDGSNVYLVLISSATVPEAAHVMKALGATYALNLDGGGSSAMYIGGSYRVGPGRLLPNAVLIVPR